MDVDRGKGYNPWGQLRKLKAADTVEMVSEEAAVLTHLEERGTLTLWELYRLVVDPALSVSHQKAARARLLALTVRLSREGKVTRARSHHGFQDLGRQALRRGTCSYLVLGPSYVKPTKDLAEAPEDLSRPLCDVAGAGGLAPERGPVPEGRVRCVG